jgi:hypothetical protein
VIRWESNLNDSLALFQVSYDANSNWQNVEANLNLNKSLPYFQLKDTTCFIKLKLQTATKTFISDSILLLKVITPHVNYVYTDSVSLSWPSIHAVNQYQVYTLGNKTLEPLSVISDTVLQLKPNQININKVAISPIYLNKSGLPGNLVFYREQGVACFYNLFMVNLQADNTALIQLNIAPLPQIQSIAIQKANKNIFETIFVQSVEKTASFSFIDQHLYEGRNKYRAQILFKDGSSVFTEEFELLFQNDETFLVFPNPWDQQKTLNIWNKNADEIEVSIYNQLGRVIWSKKLNSIYNEINDLKLSKGIYYITVNSSHFLNRVKRLSII